MLELANDENFRYAVFLGLFPLGTLFFFVSLFVGNVLGGRVFRRGSTQVEFGIPKADMAGYSLTGKQKKAAYAWALSVQADSIDSHEIRRLVVVFKVARGIFKAVMIVVYVTFGALVLASVILD